MNEFTSNNKYAPSLKVPIIIQYISKILYAISEKLTIFFAAKLFTTPISFKRPKRELGMLQTSQVRKIYLPENNKKVEILSYGFSNKKVLLAHGWCGRNTQLFMIANKLLENGFMVISFDGPSHGNSDGKTTNLLEFISTIKEINKKFGPFEAAVGHSFGSMSILNNQAQSSLFKCIVTIGSGDKISTILENFSYNLGLKRKFGKKLQNYLENKWNIKFDEYASNKVAKDIDVPVLVVHDSLDGDVDINCAINIRQNLKNGKLLITNGLGHTKILRNKNISNRIVNFIKENT